MEDLSQQKLNPWFSIWTRPRATIQQIVETDPRRLVLLLAALGGFSTVLDRASMRNLGDKLDWPVLLLLAAVVGPIAGIVTLYIGAALLRWTGSWIGGQASAQNIRAAMAWSTVPEVWGLLLWIPAFALFGQELFTSTMPSVDANPSLSFILLGFAVISLVIGIWEFVIFLKCLGQVQGFSAWKALGNAVMASMVVLLPVIIVVVAMTLVNR
jgi:hypothetical protein